MNAKFHSDFHHWKMSAVAAAVAVIAVGFVGCGDGNLIGPRGKVVDGYVADANLFADVDRNGSCETDTLAKTDQQGNFSLGASFDGYTLCARGGTDISFTPPQPFVGELRAPAGATQITPLTTMVQAVIDAAPAGSKPTPAQAATTVLGKLNSALDVGKKISASTNLLTDDPVASVRTNPALLRATVMVQTLVKGVAVAAAGPEANSVQINTAYRSAVAALVAAGGLSAEGVVGSNSFSQVEKDRISAGANAIALATGAVAGLTDPQVIALVTNATTTTTQGGTTTTAAATTSTTAAATSTTLAVTTTTAAQTTTTRAATTTTAAPTTTTRAATTTTAAPTTTTTRAATTTTAAPTTTTRAATTTTAAPTTTTRAATTTTAAPTTTTRAATTTTAAPTTTTTVTTTTTTTQAPSGKYTIARTGTLQDGKGLFQTLIPANTTVTFTYTISGVGAIALPFTVSAGVTGVKVNGVLVDTTDPTSAIAKDGDTVTLKGVAPNMAFVEFAGNISFGIGKPTGWIGVCSGASTNSGTPPSIVEGSPFPSVCPQS